MFNVVLLAGIALIPPAAASQPAAPFQLSVTGGGSRGTLVFDASGVSYKAENPAKSRQWSYHELKQIRVVSPREVALDTFEDRSRWRFSADRTIEFQVSTGAVEGHQVAFLLEHVERPVASVVLPTGLGEPRHRIDAKHLRRARGTHGTLAIYAAGLAYETSEEDDSRYWRFSDIESILRVSPFRLLINVYDRGSVRPLAFELKSSLPGSAFDYVWEQVNRPTDRTGDGR